MSSWEIFIIAIHVFAYGLWAADSKTIESWRNRRRYIRALKAHEREHEKTKFDKAVEKLIAEERGRDRKNAISRHPAGSARAGSFTTDNETLARLARQKNDRNRHSWKYSPTDVNFWPIFRDDDRG